MTPAAKEARETYESLRAIKNNPLDSDYIWEKTVRAALSSIEVTEEMKRAGAIVCFGDSNMSVSPAALDRIEQTFKAMLAVLVKE